jgi:hypothetical protein
MSNPYAFRCLIQTTQFFRANNRIEGNGKKPPRLMRSVSDARCLPFTPQKNETQNICDCLTLSSMVLIQ